jgi:pyruvate formate lyase activating enzyme
MLDFPDRTACIAWVAGCNMRCGYCHNPQIVLQKGSLGEAAVLAFLERRRGLLDGVVLSGGEATTWPGLHAFAQRATGLGFALKLDTNGLRPEVIARLLEDELVDRIALDYKAPPLKFREVTGVAAWNRFSSTLDLLSTQDKVPFEVRTTAHADLLDRSDLLEIARDLRRRGYRGPWTLQQALAGPDRPTLGNLRTNPTKVDIAWLTQRSPLRIVAQ